MAANSDIEEFVETQEHAIRRYRKFYMFLDLTVIAIFLYTLFTVLNMDDLFSMSRALELYADSQYQILGTSISFASIALILVSVILAALLTTVLHLRDQSLNILFLVEDKYPILRERLRTAYDNRNDDNIIVNELTGSVMTITSKVRSFSFLNKRRVKSSILLLIVTLVMFSYVTITDYRSDITPEDMKDIVDDIPFIPQQENETAEDMFTIEEEEESGDGAGDEDLMGEPAVIVVEGEEVDLTLPPGAGEGFTASEDEEDAPPDFESSSAYEVGKMSSPAYYEELPEGYETIIRSYFKEMASNK
ncbi:MAG: hypothetical protein U9N13_06100 [Euryarchaeota archaeon]|nr:hypothetical protein [Euryarchaeota archaeon]